MELIIAVSAVVTSGTVIFVSSLLSAAATSEVDERYWS